MLGSRARARSLAVLFCAGGTLTLVSLLFPHWRGLNTAGLAAPAVIAEVVCLVLLVAGGRLPLGAFHLLLGLGSLCIGTAVHFAGPEVYSVFSAYFVWIALYAFHFFTRRAASVHLGLAGICYLAAVATSPHTAPGPAWIVVMGTAAVAGLVVSDLASKVNRLARTDPLTGVANRRAWTDNLEREVARASRLRRPLCVAVLDLDGLKAVNDLRGHRAGDDVIIAATRNWQAMLRSQDFLARLGGDEFGVVLPDCELNDAKMVLNRMNEALDGLTVSSGISCLAPGEAPEELCGRADAAMYEAKRSGRSRVVTAS
ncbi:MAG: hypothetical protein NVS3B21_00200 [Acidimicrobiales bacterium]